MKSKQLLVARLVGSYVVFAIVTVIMTFPFVWMVSGSLKSPDLVFRYPPVIIPPTIEFNNYTEIFTDIPMIRYLLNSALVTGMVVGGGLFINSLAAYAFSRLRFPGRDLLFVLMLTTIMIPFQSIMLPLFLVVKSFGWLDSYQGLIIPWLFSPFSIFLLRQSFRTIPQDLEDAARIDGYSRFSIYLRIILPLSKPVLAALGIITFLWSWNSLLWPLLITQSEAVRVVQLGIAEYQSQYFNTWHLLMAACTVATIPTLVVFLSLQKYFVKGVSTTGLKG